MLEIPREELKVCPNNNLADIINSLGKDVEYRRIISGYIFEHDVYDNEVIKKDMVQFSNCIFERSLNIKKAEKKDIFFDRCIFRDVKINGNNLTLGFIKVKCSDFDCFASNSDIRLISDTIEKLDIGGSQNELLVSKGTYNTINISKRNFDLPSIINVEDCKADVILLMGKLENEITLTGIKIKTFFISHFINKGYVWIRNLQLIEGFGNIEIHTSDLKGVRFMDCELDKFSYHVRASDLSGAIFSNCGFIKYDGEGSTRDIYRQLKLSAKTNEDSVSYLYYRSKELDAYKKELKGTKPRITNDKIILWLSRWSNYYGFKWTIAIDFILIFSILFFSLCIKTLDNWPVNFGWVSCSQTMDSFTLVTKTFFNFINPTHSLDIFDNYSPNLFTYLFDFSGRIFVGFGIYQLIKAFRKFVL